jgi:predicted dehydrogenase
LAAAEILKNPALGPVLYYNVSVVNNVALGIKYHATEWRAVPDYQGGFLLDGGVHFAAAIRVCLADKRSEVSVSRPNAPV